MCLEWLFSRKKPYTENLTNYSHVHATYVEEILVTQSLELIVHMGAHDTGDINRRLISGYGTVRCNRCWKSFDTVADMSEHPCVYSTSAIQGLSPIGSSDSLESVVIHE